jgi:hypothetical protein
MEYRPPREAYIGDQRILEVPRHEMVRVDGEFVAIPYEEALLRACAGERLTTDWF